MVKVYRHMNCMSYVIPWQIEGKTFNTILGRPLLEYERPALVRFDPDSHEVDKDWSRRSVDMLSDDYQESLEADPGTPSAPKIIVRTDQ